MDLTVTLQSGSAVTLTSPGGAVTLVESGFTAALSQPATVATLHPESSRVVTLHTGPPGANAELVILSLADYLALALEVQMDGRWYVIPKSP